MREISDSKKVDLEKVACDHNFCGHRGDYGKCYITVGNGKYDGCMNYKLWKQYGNQNTDNRDT